MSEITGTTTKSFDYNGITIEFTARCSCSYSYRRGCMYLSNGDPGYPDEEDYEDLECEEYEEIHAWDDQGYDVAENIPDIEEICDKWFEDNVECSDVEWDYDE